jgi:hypothetical protein
MHRFTHFDPDSAYDCKQYAEAIERYHAKADAQREAEVFDAEQFLDNQEKLCYNLASLLKAIKRGV